MNPHFHYEHRSTARVRLWMPVVVSLIVQIPAVFLDYGPTRDSVVVTTNSGVDLAYDFALALLGPLALIWARRFPGPVVAFIAVAASADLLLADGVDGPPYIAFAFAIGAAIVRGARVWAWASIAVSWTGTLALAALSGLEWQPWRIAGITIGILFIVGAAEGIRTKREHAEVAQRDFVVRQQAVVQAERVRIARELHDVLAHSLSQINVQASVGLHLMEKDSQKAAEALANIKESSKSALDEVRSVLGALRSDGGSDGGSSGGNGDGVGQAPLVPEPNLSRVASLASALELQGIAVTFDDDISPASEKERAGKTSYPEPPQAMQLAIYRIVQESLTNVGRHSNASQVNVALSRSDGSYHVRVADNGTAWPDSKQYSGRGLVGMRERAELLGGTLESGRNAAGGFEIVATIPTHGESS
ncbi:MAG: sensor histidine kinase [Microbacteriaceae bacterium]